MTAEQRERVEKLRDRLTQHDREWRSTYPQFAADQAADADALTALLAEVDRLAQVVETVRFRCSESFRYPAHFGRLTPYQEGRHDGINMERRDVAALLPVPEEGAQT